MAEAKKTSHKPTHPAFSRMICEAMHAMDETHVGEEHHNHPGHSLQSLKKYIGEHYEVSLALCVYNAPVFSSSDCPTGQT